MAKDMTAEIKAEYQALKRAEELSILRAQLSNREGRAFFMDLFNRCGCNGYLFVPSSEVYKRAALHDLTITYQADIDELGYEVFSLLQLARDEYAKQQMNLLEAAKSRVKERKENV